VLEEHFTFSAMSFTAWPSDFINTLTTV